MPHYRAPRTQHQRMDGLTGDYPTDWKEIADRIKDAAGRKCERCSHEHDVAAGYMLTVHHLDLHKPNVADWNLAALCQKCHLRIQGRVDFYQEYMLAHTPWMQLHVDGFKQALADRQRLETDYNRPSLSCGHLSCTGIGRISAVMEQHQDAAHSDLVALGSSFLWKDMTCDLCEFDARGELRRLYGGDWR